MGSGPHQPSAIMLSLLKGRGTAAATARRPLPAGRSEHADHLGRHLARAPGHIHPPVTQYPSPVGHRGVVASHVPQPHLAGVRGPPVKLDHHAEIGVPHVVVEAPATGGSGMLADPARQPVPRSTSRK